MQVMVENVVRPLTLKGFCVLFNIFLTSIDLHLYQLYLSQTAVDVRSIAQILADWSSTFGTLFQFYSHLLSFICLLVVIYPHVLVHSCVFNDVSTVLQLNEVSLRLVLSAEENLCDLIMITDATFGWTFVSTQTYAWVSAIQGLGTGFSARWTIARLMAKLTAALMGTLPSAGLNARSTGLSTWLHTLAVHAAIFTWSLTGGAITSARLLALVRANQKTLTLVRTWAVEPSLITLATGTGTGMATFKLFLTRGCTCRLLRVNFVKACILLAVAAL